MPMTQQVKTALSDRYTIEREIGAGGMATVYLAHDIRHQRRVALKVLDPDLAAVLGVERFLSEIRVTANLQHPNLLPLFDSGEADGLFYYVMPHVDGESLRATLQRVKQLPIADSLHIAIGIAGALDYAHRHGVIHRDLKPENVLLLEGQPLVADFGIALAVSNAGGHRITQTGISLGTPQYMSPEQATGDRLVDGRSDIYSLGAVLYEMIAGEPPHTGSTAQAIIARVLTEKPRSLRLTRPAVSAEVEAAVECALAKVPADRFATAAEFAAALLTAAPAHVTGYAANRAPVPWSARLRHVGAAAAAALALVGAFVGGRLLGVRPSVTPTAWQGLMLGGPVTAIEPRASPDGKTIAFAAMIDGQTQLAVLTPASGDWKVRTTSRERGNAEKFAWSLDGTRIYFSRFSDGPRGVFSISPVEGEERLVLEDARGVEVMPDNSLLVARINAQRVEQLHRFWPETQKIEALNAISSAARLAGGLQFQAFHDRREVVFYGKPASDPMSTDHLYAIDLASGRVRRLAPSATIVPSAWRFPLAVSDDDESVLIDLPAGDLHRIVAVPRDGSDRLQTVLTLTAIPYSIDVASDGSLYVDQVLERMEVHRFKPSTGTLERGRLSGAMSGAHLLALRDGRALVTERSGGWSRVVVIAGGKNPESFLQTSEESGWPMAPLGQDQVAVTVGSAPNRTIAIASLATGRIMARPSISANEIVSLGGSPDGRTLFFVRGDFVWSIPREGGAPRKLHPGNSLAVDPSGKYLVIQLNETSAHRLVRFWLDQGTTEEIRLRDTLRLTADVLSPNAVGRDGRIVARVSSSSSWFWPAGLLDPKTGLFELIPPGFAADVDTPGWAGSDLIIGRASTIESSLWRFRPM